MSSGPADERTSSASFGDHNALKSISTPVAYSLQQTVSQHAATMVPVPAAPESYSSLVSPLSAQPTHLSARRTFAGGIVRYYTTPDAVVVSASTTTIHSPIKLARSWLTGCQHRSWWSNRLELHLFSDVAIWKAALIEGLGTTLLTFIVLVTVTSILNHKQDYSYFPTAIAICHIPIIAFLIFATATATGGRQQHSPVLSDSLC